MDFISNLIKRPISLVSKESSNTMDTMAYHPLSASLPNTPNAALESRQLQPNNNGQINQRNNMSASYNGGHMTDFIGVPEEFLDEFKDILPPPPLTPILQDTTADSMAQSLLDMDNIPPPPPPPAAAHCESTEEILTPSMKASQTIDELLLHINDDLQQAGLNDEVLAIASPPNKSELSPLSSKASLNNSKLSNASPASATNIQNVVRAKSPTNTASAAGSASTIGTVFENNSSIHKFHIDPELELECDGDMLFDDHNQLQLQQQQQHQQESNNSGVNKSSNKFVGLTEFDEAKIPELPGDLNPNIEEQYNVTFEECFIPTLTAHQGTQVPNEFVVDKTHLLLPTETDAISSDYETFVDCSDDPLKDPLGATFAEPATQDVTTDVDSYQSAMNNTLNTSLNDTMENIADITMEAVGQPLQYPNQTEVLAEPHSESKAQQFESMDEDEPMDIDLNATMEMIHNTSNNIQHVEKVLQHAENILQHIADEKPLEPSSAENESGLQQLTETTKITFVVNTPVESVADVQIEHSKHELSLNKSIELPLNKSKTLSSECIIETIQEEPPKEEGQKPEVINHLNLTIDCMNTSTTSNSSNKSCGKKEAKQNLTSSLNTSITSITQKHSAPNSPSFPIKPVQIVGFPRSPKSAATKPKECAFLEKSDYLAAQENVEKITMSKDLNGTYNESLQAQNLNGKCQESLTTVKENNERLTFGVDTSMPRSSIDIEANLEDDYEKTKRKTFSIDSLGEEFKVEEKRRTFDVKADVIESSAIQFPSLDKTDNSYLTFDVNDVAQDVVPAIGENVINSRRTFNVPSEYAASETNAPDGMDISFEDMEVDDVSQNSTLPMADIIAPRSQSPPLPTLLQRSQSPPLPAKEQRSQSPPLPAKEQRCQSPPLPTMQERSQSSPLPATQQRSKSPPLPTMQEISQSSPLPATQQRSKSPLPTMQEISQSPPLPATKQQCQSLPLPAIQQRSQSPPLPTIEQRSPSPPPITKQISQSPPLPIMQPISQSPPLPTMQPRSQSPPFPTMQPRSESPPLLTMQQMNKSKIPPNSQLPRIPHNPEAISIKEEQISPPAFESTDNSSYNSQPLPALIQKRPSIRDARARAAEILSAKEQSNIKVKDEKDVFVEKFTPSPIEDIFTAVSATSTTLTNSSGFSEFDHTLASTSSSMTNNGEQLERSQQQQQQSQQEFNDEFSGNNNLILNPSDFDYLLTKGSNTTPVDRSSLLLKFDPLLGVPVPANQGYQQHQQQQHNLQQQLQQLQIPTNTTINPCLSPTLEEDEHNDSNRSFVIDQTTAKGNGNASASGGLTEASAKLLKDRSKEVKEQLRLEQLFQQNKSQLLQGVNKKNATMSVDVIKDMSLDNDCNKTFENSNSTQSDDKQINYKMDELEKKIKNEVLKTEDIEKKLKDAEQREEALIKRITEKDKTIAKMTGVIEAYEKAIAELIADKEQITQHYEKQLAEVKADRDSNYHHLTSLETTFSDLHVKYEKSKEMTCQLKESEEALQAEKRKNLENLHLQEQRYDKMKNHAMQQLEIANKKLESLTRDHSIETTKLKALLKKEEIARSSINEQLAQKTKENAELVKICDELISGQGS